VKGDCQEKRVLAARRQLQALEEAGPPPGRRPA
jgi:hypothetical protein